MRRSPVLAGLAASLALSALPGAAAAQGWGAPPPAPGGYAPAPPPYGAPPQPGYAYPPPQPPSAAPPPAAASGANAGTRELGVLYGTAAAYGVGLGVWLDSEFTIADPGIKMIPPAVLGVGAPIGVYFLDHPTPMRRGVPAAIAAGMTIGAGEGVAISTLQFTRASDADAWGFRGLARSVAIGSTVGGVAGYFAGTELEPSPKTSLVLGSSALWGATIGSMYGFGASNADAFGDSNDAGALGGIIGYNVAVLGAAAASTQWVPSYTSLLWMWIGFGAGIGVSTPVYLFYAGGDHPYRRGLIFQGTAATLGVVAGAVLTADWKDAYAADDRRAPHGFAQITGIGPMAVPGGGGAQITGVLF